MESKLGLLKLQISSPIEHHLILFIVRSRPGKNGPFFLSRFSQWIQLTFTSLFKISFWATLNFALNSKWRPKSKMAAVLHIFIRFEGALDYFSEFFDEF